MNNTHWTIPFIFVVHGIRAFYGGSGSSVVQIHCNLERERKSKRKKLWVPLTLLSNYSFLFLNCIAFALQRIQVPLWTKPTPSLFCLLLFWFVPCGCLSNHMEAHRFGRPWVSSRQQGKMISHICQRPCIPRLS